MGCHTWFNVPYITDKKEIIKMAQETVDRYVEKKWIGDGSRQMYQYAIDNELQEPVCELATSGEYSHYKEIEWTLYLDVQDADMYRYNKEHGTTYESKYDMPEEIRDALEGYSDEPRIGGYPDTIIKSYVEMLKFMETGYTDSDNEHHVFRYEEDRYPMFMEGIKTFFTKHPQGIITFG